MFKNITKRVLKSDWLTDKAVRFFNYVEKEKIKRDTETIISKLKAFGPYSRINGAITVQWPYGIIIGNNVHIGANGFLDGTSGIIIGDNTHISRNLTLYSTKHHYQGDKLPFNTKYRAKEVIIDKNVWIGMNVYISPGVHIGEGAIIETGAVINQNVGAGEIVASNKQHTIGQRDPNHYREHEEGLEYGGISGRPLRKTDVQKFLVKPFQVKEVVFILSTGRCGSKSMAKMFTDSPSVSAFHETFYTLLKRLSLEYIAGKVSKVEAKEKIHTYFNSVAFIKKETVYIESDQKLVPFIDILNELFDDPKFIWLIRHPKTFMHSAVSRGWFAEDDPCFYKNRVLIDPNYTSHGTRVTGELTGDYSQSDWKNLDKRMKALWYWKYWNNLIKDGLEDIPQRQKLFLQLETLDKKKDEVLEFLGLEKEKKIAIKKTNTVKKKDAQAYDQTKKDNYKFFEEEGYKEVEKEMHTCGYKR